jgi:hypothetical protein
MNREPRDPDARHKPAVASWFKKNKQAKSHFDPVIDFLNTHYTGDNFGFINKKAYPEYRFNSISKGENYVVVRASKNHTRVRFKIDHNEVSSDFKEYTKKLKSKDGSRFIDFVDFLVFKTEDLKLLSDFITSHSVDNFDKNCADSRKLDEINEPDGGLLVRLIQGGMVQVSEDHSRLQKKFIEWAKARGTKNIQEEFVLANGDRIDVRLNFRGKNVFSELKTVSGSSTKRAIREALGQLLDYQYHGETIASDELWIVVDGECNKDDKRFINKLIINHKLPLVLLWEKNNEFLSFPPIKK